MNMEFIAKTLISKVDFLQNKKSLKANTDNAENIDKQSIELTINQEFDKNNISEYKSSLLEKIIKKFLKSKKTSDKEKSNKPTIKEKAIVTRQQEIKTHLQATSSVPDYIISKLIDYLEQMHLLDMDMFLIEKSALSIFELHNQMSTHSLGAGNISNYLAMFDHNFHIIVPSQLPDNYWQNKIVHEFRTSGLGNSLF